MLDTGAEISIRKRKVLPIEFQPDLSNRIVIKGITNTPILTDGTITILICNYPITFHIVNDELNMRHDGILGSEYFTNAQGKIDYENKVLEIGTFKIPFEQEKRKESHLYNINQTINKEQTHFLHSIYKENFNDIENRLENYSTELEKDITYNFDEEMSKLNTHCENNFQNLIDFTDDNLNTNQYKCLNSIQTNQDLKSREEKLLESLRTEHLNEEEKIT